MHGLRWFAGLAGLITLGAGCDGPLEVVETDDLTSASAVERELTLKGLVYVAAQASSYTVESAVQRQVRTAFGPLRLAEISVDDRELNTVDPTSFVAEDVQLVRKDASGLTPIKKVRRVSYTYRARALVANKHASKTSFSTTLLMGSYQSFVSEIIKDCVKDYAHDQEFQSSFWYVWAPAQAACQTLISTEVTAIEQERQGLLAGQLGEKEHARRFLPVTAQLKPVAPPRTTYPELDQLLALDEVRDRVVVYQIIGMAAHDGDPENERFANDLKFAEAFKLIKLLADRWKSLRVAPQSPVDPGQLTFKGKSYSASFAELYSWAVLRSGFPAGLASSDRDAFRRALHDHIYRKWMVLEVPLQVTGGRAPKQLTLELRLLYGSDSDYTTRSYFREAFKKGQVVLYMGHSYIGTGPQDPSNYSPADFFSGYQIVFFQSCVSFNYYGVDYFDLKPGGSKKLDLITNGVESYVVDGGKSMAQFILALFDGPPRTWLEILKRTRASTYWGLHDPNRNVDGEQDNTFDPAFRPISVSEASAPPPLTVKNTTAACGGTASGSIALTASSSGAARVDFLVNGVTVSSDSQPPYASSWNSSSVPDGSATITVKAFDAAGKSVSDACTVTVANGTAGELFFDDVEQGAGGWTASGLWHRAVSSACASPAHASPVSAWYFGKDSSCDYSTGAAVKGTLTSAPVSGISASSRLSFQYLREVESETGSSYDETRVEIGDAAGSSWKTVWSKSSRDASGKSWQSSGEISLAAWAGQSVRIRFSFDSKDSYANKFVGWMVDDVLVTP